jgi:(p)ppGpp synthase/HD superfamily hydrolase
MACDERVLGVRLGDRFFDALDYAARLHAGDVRKGTGVPYIAHLLSVCALVLTDGGSEDEAIAALLHDALEDHPEEVSREDIAVRFGEPVAEIVEDCTDTPPDYAGGEKPPWRERKIAKIEHIARGESRSRRVALADKLDNARAMLADYREVGERLWERFAAGREDQLWYYRGLVDGFRAGGASGCLFEELERVVKELERAVRASSAPRRGSPRRRSARPPRRKNRKT